MLQQNASSYNIPIFFSETGCNKPASRTFTDQAAIFGSDMSGTWSGAIIYEWLEEANDYGLISYGPSVAATATEAMDGFTRTGTPLPVTPDFDNLSQQWALAKPSSISADAYTPSNSPPACPAYTSGLWDVNGGVALPTLGQTYNAQVQSSLSAGTAASEATGSKASSSPSASRSAANANPAATPGQGRQILGTAFALVSVMLGFIWWL